MRRVYAGLLLFILLFLSDGCSAAHTYRPVEAIKSALLHPEVAQWHAEHAAPGVIAGLNGTQAKRWRRYRPAEVVDLEREGLLLRFEARIGPEPRRLEVLVDRVTGGVQRVTKVNR